MIDRQSAIAKLTAPGMTFEIGREEVRGQEVEVFVNRQRSLTELLEMSRGHGDVDYLVSQRVRLSHAEHYAQVAALATALRDEYGVTKGDRVAICAANMPEWVVAFWAISALGGVTVAMNAMGAPLELAHGVELTQPMLILADARRRELLGDPGVPVLDLVDDVAGLVDKHRGAALPQVEVGEDDPAVILFTSGTTGRPKGATHSVRNVISALSYHLLNDAIAAEMGMPQAGRRYLMVSPLFHIASLHNLAVIRLVVGDTAVVHEGRFDIEQVLDLVEAERVTNWGAVPTMLARLVEADLTTRDLSSLRTISVNSAPSSPWLKQRLREALPQAGRSLGTTYGLTESSTGATLATAAELVENPDTVGRAIPTMEIEIRDADNRRVPDGAEGDVCLRGAHVMLGYWRNEEATADSLTPDGWFRTGDLGSMKDGFLSIASRRSDLILRGGENVYPAEVEDQIGTHPAVRECIVLGVPDADFGQAVAAVVVRRPGADLDEAGLRAHLSDRLARYKLPTRWRFTDEELPRNATGKVNRREVVLP